MRERRSKYIVYDAKGKILLITRDKRVATHMSKLASLGEASFSGKNKKKVDDD
tara:strand:- start:363 stop:521 length:159 start_codon:yes stop_codon:yes gene_type:complete